MARPWDDVPCPSRGDHDPLTARPMVTRKPAFVRSLTVLLASVFLASVLGRVHDVQVASQVRPTLELLATFPAEMHI